MSNSAILKNATWKQCNIKWYKIRIVEHNIVQHLHSATVNGVTTKSATYIGEKLK